MTDQQSIANGANAQAANIMNDQKRKSMAEEVKESPSVTKEESHESTDKKTTGDEAQKKSNKRRKVNHACVYCRRSHMTCDSQRPCTRCIKRDIGHLCHDEHREPVKKQKSEADGTSTDKQEPAHVTDEFPPFGAGDDSLLEQSKTPSMGAPQIAQPEPILANQFQQQSNSDQSLMNYGQSDFGTNTDMHHLHPFNAFTHSETHSEYQLLGDFLNNSLLDDGGMYGGDDLQAFFNDPMLTTNAAMNASNNHAPSNQPTQPGIPSAVQAGNEISRPSSAFPIDQKARDKFFLTAADPAGNDSPEERMNRLLKAKYDAGLLKPFNYVKGYARLNNYMEKNMRPASRQKILRQLDKFRPKFREAMQSLTDIQLVKVEMWFERSLMEYDRVFASMAIPACCWRRTGEIFRGNKEMAELIHVPIEQLRDVGNIENIFWNMLIIPGQTRHPRYHCGRLACQLLGKVRSDRFRSITKGNPDKLFAEEPGSFFKRSDFALLFFIYYSS